MITSEMTKGMSSLEVWIVMLAALASQGELKRLTAFFNEYEKEQYHDQR